MMRDALEGGAAWAGGFIVGAGVFFAVVQTQGPSFFKDTNRCLIDGYYQDCPSAERPPQWSEKEKTVKFTITVATLVSQNADGTRRHVVIETHELTGYTGPHARADAEAAVRRAHNNRCDIRRVVEEQE